MSTAGAGARTAVRRTRIAAALAVALLFPARGGAHAAPRVVVTVKPLHALVAGVMAGLGDPELIIRGAGSPHTYTLKPSDARLLERAHLVFWIGEPLESFMAKPLAALSGRARVVGMLRAPGVTVRPGRAGGAWDGEAETDADHREHGRTADPAHHGGHAGGGSDGHLWLDPANARAIAWEVARVLGVADPVNRGRYAANAAALAARIDALDAELRGLLAPVRDIPFIVFHDAYQYFEASYALRAVGSITVSAERAPGARRVQQMRARIRSRGPRCVFSEPQFPSALLATLLEGSEIRTGTLDPLGVGLAPGPDAYFTLMRALGAAFADCLRPR